MLTSRSGAMSLIVSQLVSVMGFMQMLVTATFLPIKNLGPNPGLEAAASQ